MPEHVRLAGAAREVDWRRVAFIALGKEVFGVALCGRPLVQIVGFAFSVGVRHWHSWLLLFFSMGLGLKLIRPSTGVRWHPHQPNPALPTSYRGVQALCAWDQPCVAGKTWDRNKRSPYDTVSAVDSIDR